MRFSDFFKKSTLALRFQQRFWYPQNPLTLGNILHRVLMVEQTITSNIIFKISPEKLRKIAISSQRHLAVNYFTQKMTQMILNLPGANFYSIKLTARWRCEDIAIFLSFSGLFLKIILLAIVYSTIRTLCKMLPRVRGFCGYQKRC